jgi:hypothetical protein
MGCTIDIQLIMMINILIAILRIFMRIKTWSCSENNKLCCFCNPLEFWFYVPSVFYVMIRLLLIANGVKF